MQDARVDAILDVIAQSASIDRARLVPDVTLDELGVTSLTLIETVFELESRFDVEISVDGVLMKPEVTLRDLLARIIDAIDAKAGESARVVVGSHFSLHVRFFARRGLRLRVPRCAVNVSRVHRSIVVECAAFFVLVPHRAKTLSHPM